MALFAGFAVAERGISLLQRSSHCLPGPACASRRAASHAGPRLVRPQPKHGQSAQTSTLQPLPAAPSLSRPPPASPSLDRAPASRGSASGERRGGAQPQVRPALRAGGTAGSLRLGDLGGSGSSGLLWAPLGSLGAPPSWRILTLCPRSSSAGPARQKAADSGRLAFSGWLFQHAAAPAPPGPPG